MEAVAPAALEGGAAVGSTVAVRGGLSGSGPLPKVVLEGEVEDVVFVEDVEAAAVVVAKVGGTVGGGVGGGGPLHKVVVEGDVCVALVEVSVGLGRKVASVVCVVVVAVVGGVEGGGSSLPKVVVEVVVCVALVEVVASRGRSVASVVCVAALVVVVVEAGGGVGGGGPLPKVVVEGEVEDVVVVNVVVGCSWSAAHKARPSTVGWQPRWFKVAKSRKMV